MGICADIIQYDGKINEPKELFYITEYKEICYIGGRESFTDDVLKHYNCNMGCFTFKEGWKFITKERQREIKSYLCEKFNTRFDFLLEKQNWYITLGY